MAASQNLFYLRLVIGLFTVLHVDCRAHHKVHNLALYPERHSWCQATPIRQEISHAPDCEPTVIDNVVCLGACFSYSVPKAQDYEPIAPYCDKCDKTVTSWTVVTLNCTNETTGEIYQLPRNVELIQNCSCVDCNDNSIRQPVESVEDGNEVLEEDDIPDTIERNDLHDSHHHQSPDTLLRGILSRHKLKSVSSELNQLSNADIERMIQENKIPSDDDHDQADAARRERQRSTVNTPADHDL